MDNDDNGGGAPIWLLSFTDVIALMLTFFVLLFAMSDPDPDKWENKVGVLRQGTGEFNGPMDNAGTREGVNVDRYDFAMAENLDYMQALFEDLIIDYPDVQKFMTIRRTKHKLYLLLNDVFEDGNDRVSEDFKLFLQSLTPVLNGMDNKMNMTISGDTNNAVFVMQRLSSEFVHLGYRKPIALQTAMNKLVQDADIVLSFDPHDGRRISR